MNVEINQDNFFERSASFFSTGANRLSGRSDIFCTKASKSSFSLSLLLPFVASSAINTKKKTMDRYIQKVKEHRLKTGRTNDFNKDE